MKNKYTLPSLIMLIILILSSLIYKFMFSNIFIKYLLFYITLIGGSMFLSIILKKRIERTIPLNILIIFTLMYIFGICGILEKGVYIVGIVNYFLFLISIYLILLRKDNKKNILTSGLLFITLMFFCFSFATYKSGFVIWDEYSYWSIASKNMYYLNDFVLNPNNTLNFTPYPPFPTLLQYFFCKSVGQYSQGGELFISVIMGFAFMLPILKNSKSTNKIKSLLIFGILICIPSIFVNSLFYKTIYVDTILGLLFGYIVYEYFTSEKDKFLYLELFLAIGVLSLAKATGLVFSLLFLILVGIDLIINSKFKIKKIFSKKNILVVCLILSSILLFYGSWTVYKESKPVIVNGSVYQDDSFSASGLVVKYLRTIKQNLMDGSDEYYNESLKNFSKNALDNHVYNDQPIAFSLITWLVIFCLFGIYIYKKSIKDKERKYFFRNYSISLLIITIVYILFVQMSYLDVFSISDSLVHASIQRYIGSMLFALLYFLVGTYLQTIEKKENTKTLVLFLIVLMFTPIAPITDITINSSLTNCNSQRELYFQKNLAEKLIKNTEENSNIFMIHQNRMKDTNLSRVRYFMTPKFVVDVDVLGENNYSTSLHFYDIESLNKALYDSYDYVYIFEKDDNLINNYGAIFESEIKDWTLYKIVKDENNHSVKLVEKEMKD